MSFVDDASKSGARPVYCVSIATRRCILNYGQSPCQAQVGVTGDQKCFNTFATCQDLQNIDTSDNFFYRFIEPIDPVPEITGVITGGFGPFPFLSGPPKFSPSQLDPGGGLGVRASVTISFSDAPHHDRVVDDYVTERPYDPMETGTFWGKWLARNPFYIGQRVLIELGHVDDNNVLDLSNSQRLWYVVESINGPDSNGNISITAKDVLKLADNVRAQCPAPSSGTLLAELQEGETQFFVTPAEALADYPDPGQTFKVRIGDEIIRCSRSGDTFTVLGDTGSESPNGRGIDNTDESSHKEDSTVQLVKEFTAQTVPAILEELLTDFASVPSLFIDSSQWDQAQSQIGFLFSAQISEPEGVKDLCEQLLKSAGAFIYYDERVQKIRLGAIIPTPELETIPILNDDANFLQDTVTITRKDETRLSQVWYFRGLIDSTDSLEDPVNYENRLISRDIEAETADLYGQKKVGKIWARWTPRENAAAAFVVSGRRLNRFSRTPRMVTFQMDTKDSAIWANDLVAIRHRNLQGPTGEEQLTPFQILKVSHTGHSRVSYAALEYNVAEVPDFGQPDTVVIDQDTTNANILEIYELTIGPAAQAGPVVTVLVLNGVNVRGMIGGGFPDSSIRLVNRGNIAGLAGAGGNGGGAIAEAEFQTAFAAANGSDGGDAITMNEDWEILNLGNIYGGAGGGGGGASAVTDGPTFNAAGGGGGGSGRDLLGTIGGFGGEATAVDSAASGQNGGTGDEDGAGVGGSGGITAGAVGGMGGNGGDWATAGSPGSSAAGDGTGTFGSGGAAGNAIVSNGFNLDLTEEGVIVGDKI